MENKIIFRAFSNEKRIFVYGNLLDSEQGMFIIPKETNEIIEVDPKTISQYIGIADANGSMIFENDIIESFSIVNNKKENIKFSKVVRDIDNCCFIMKEIFRIKDNIKDYSNTGKKSMIYNWNNYGKEQKIYFNVNNNFEKEIEKSESISK